MIQLSLLYSIPNWTREFGVTTDKSWDLFLRASRLPAWEQKSFVFAETDDESEACSVLNALNFAINKGILNLTL